MKIFEFTRLKLTVWYVLIIMAVSAMFSFVIFRGVTSNIEASFRRAEVRLRSDEITPHLIQNVSFSKRMTGDAGREFLHQLFLDEIEESKQEVFYNLLILNAIILAFSAFASYYLAGKTLGPIEEIVFEQKRFIADASHELKTPLTSLKTSIEVALRDNKLPKKAKDILRENLEDVDALNDLISQLLFLASQENHKLVFQKIDLKEVLEKSIRVVKPISKDRDIEIKSNLRDITIMADFFSVKELFVILLDNAIKYSQHGGTVTVKMNSTNNFVRVQVTDTGIGINKKYLPNIFDRFYRIDNARCIRQCSGYGLGLSMAKKIVENHNGKISVKSEIAKGTTFTIKFPVKK